MAEFRAPCRSSASIGPIGSFHPDRTFAGAQSNVRLWSTGDGRATKILFAAADGSNLNNNAECLFSVGNLSGVRATMPLARYPGYLCGEAIGFR